MRNILMSLVVLVGLSGAAYSACYGPFCYDDTGVSIKGTVASEGAIGLPSKTKAQLLTETPRDINYLFGCSDCSVGTGWDNICVSTGTGQGAWVHVSSKTIKCN